MIKRAYVRFLGDAPSSSNVALAAFAFNEMGMNVVPFQGFGDVESDVDCGPEALVCGFIEDVYKALDKLELPRPPSIDYPEELRAHYGRRIWEGTLDEIQDRGLHPGVFVKPRGYQKLFTGFVWRGQPACRLRLAPYPKDTPVFFAEPVTFIAEHRCYVLDGEIAGVHFYKGDWSQAPNRYIVERAVQAYRPYRAYAIDFGVLPGERTAVVEVNDAFALGNYGLHSHLYARMIEARWEELTQSLTVAG